MGTRRILESIALPFIALLAECQSAQVVPPATSQAPPAHVGRVENVKAQTLVLRDFRLQSGVVMKEAVVAYETYGTLDPTGRNAVLVTHGNTSSHHAAGHYAPGRAALGVDEKTLG